MYRKFAGKFNNLVDLGAIFYITLLRQMIEFGILPSFSFHICSVLWLFSLLSSSYELVSGERAKP